MNVKQNARSYSDRVALITGASSGFGLLAAVTLAQNGYRIVATMRDPETKGPLLEAAAASGVSDRILCIKLDVTDSSDADHAAELTIANFGRIDVLVNNAGIAVGGFVEEVPMEAWRRQMETNFFGLVAVTKAVIPFMRRERCGTIINVSSMSGRFGFPGFAPYASSKFAVEGFSEALRHELLPFGIYVTLIEPGSFKTSIWQKGFSSIYKASDSPYQESLESVLHYTRNSAENAPDPKRVADLILHIAGMRAPGLRYPIGQGVRAALLAKAIIPWRWFESIVARSLRNLPKR